MSDQNEIKCRILLYKDKRGVLIRVKPFMVSNAFVTIVVALLNKY